MTSCVGYILETLRCKKLLLYRDIAWVCNVQHYGVTLGVTFGFAKMSSAAIFEISLFAEVYGLLQLVSIFTFI